MFVSFRNGWGNGGMGECEELGGGKSLVKPATKGSVEVIRATDVLVHRQGPWLGGGQALLAVQPALEDVGDTAQVG